MDRATAMSVPSVARARNIICGIIGSLPLEQYNRLTGAHVGPLRVIITGSLKMFGFMESALDWSLMLMQRMAE